MTNLEIELREESASHLVEHLLSRIGTPFPTLAGLGTTRLVHAVAWNHVVFEEGPEAVRRRARGLVIRAEVEVRHFSIDELRAANDAEPKVSRGSAWLDVRARGGALEIDLLEIAIGSGNQAFIPSQRLVGEVLPVGESDIETALLMRSDGIVTLRLFGKGEHVDQRPPSNHALTFGGQWLIHVPANVIMTTFERQLTDTVVSANIGAIEEPAASEWLQYDDGAWGVRGAIGVLSEKGCGVASFSVDLEYETRLQPSSDTGELVTSIVLDTNVSDWDSFKCALFWAGMPAGGLFGPGFVEAMVLSSPVIAGIASGELVDAKPGGRIERIGETDDGVAFRSIVSLPSLPRNRIVDAVVDARGLFVLGTLLAPPVQATKVCLPSPSLASEWSTRVDCGQLRVVHEPSAQVAIVEHTITMPGADARPENVPARTFTSTTVEPAEDWRLDYERFPSARARIRVSGVEGGRAREGLLIAHTSAGVFARRVAPPGEPPVLSEVVVKGLLAGCRRLRSEWAPSMRLLWRPDPPPFVERSGKRLIRHWLVAFKDVAEGGMIRLRIAATGHGGDWVEARPSDGQTEAFVELLMETATHVEVESSGTSAPNMRVAQRYLVEESNITLPEPTAGLVKRGRKAFLRCASQTYALDLGRLRLEPVTDADAIAVAGCQAGSTVTLGGVVLVVVDGNLLLCRPGPIDTQVTEGLPCEAF